MRSYYPKSETVKTDSEYLREAGYCCTNNDKTDYNNTESIYPDKIWMNAAVRPTTKTGDKDSPFLPFSIP